MDLQTQLAINRDIQNLIRIVMQHQQNDVLFGESPISQMIINDLRATFANNCIKSQRDELLDNVHDVINAIENNDNLKDTLLYALDITREKIYLRAPSEEWQQHIGDYALRDDSLALSEHTDHPGIKDPHSAVQAILTSDLGQELLYQDAFPEGQESTEARAAFLKFLEEKFKTHPQENTTPRPTVKIEEFLGKEGLALYKAAVTEESKSREFRDAVFLKSTQHFEGDKWDRKLVLWVGGPSASGKTYGASTAVTTMSAHMPSDPENKTGNIVVSVDGGIEREVSQMRQMVLQVALAKGYKGIKDLHSNTKLGIKDYIKSAALADDNLSLVIPETFAESALLKRFSSSGAYKINEMAEYHDDPRIVQAFSEICPEDGFEKRFKTSVKHMGTGRAWFKEENEFNDSDIKINNRDIGCESKIYDEFGFNIGQYASSVAAKQLKKMDPEGFYLKITNDLVFVHRDNHGRWQECTSSDIPELRLSARDFNEWRGQYANSIMVSDLQEWLQEKKTQGTLARPLISVTPNDLVSIPVHPSNKSGISHITISERDYDRYLSEIGNRKPSLNSLERWCLKQDASAQLITPIGSIMHYKEGYSRPHSHSAPPFLEGNRHDASTDLSIQQITRNLSTPTLTTTSRAHSNEAVLFSDGLNPTRSVSTAPLSQQSKPEENITNEKKGGVKPKN